MIGMMLAVALTAAPTPAAPERPDTPEAPGIRLLNTSEILAAMERSSVKYRVETAGALKGVPIERWPE